MDPNDRVKSWHGILTGTMLLTFGYCASALAASSPDCERSVRGLQSLTVSVDALAAQPPDHIAGAEKETSRLQDAAVEVVSKAVAPILQLTPQVAAKLNSVFEAGEPTSAAIRENRTAEAGAEDASSQSTAADGDADETNMDVSFHGDDIARFQRQMYRKDI